MNILKDMLERQGEVNVSTVGPEWFAQGLDWNLAIVQESSELIDSFPWKWWKHGIPDFENARIEVVDIWHFVLSKMIEEGVEATDVFDEQLKLAANAKESSSADIVKFTKELIKSTLNDKPATDLALLTMTISGKTGMDYNTLARLYFGKAVLNDFRQTKGYKDGSYIKIWNGSEDNDVMVRLAKDIDYTDSFYDDLFSALTEEYMTVE